MKVRTLFRYGSVLLLLAALGSAAAFAAQPEPDAVQGRVLLDGWDWTRRSTLDLRGEWEFYWQQLLEPQHFRPPFRAPAPEYMRVPGPWSGPLPQTGYATYRLIVRGGEWPGPMAVRLGWTCSAYRLWVDDDLLHSQGRVGTSPDTSEPRYGPAVIPFEPAGEEIQLVIQVANFHHRCGGLWSAPVLGPREKVAHLNFQYTARDLFLAGTIFIQGLFHMALTVLNRRRITVHLMFGLFCLVMTVRVLSTHSQAFGTLLPGLPWDGLLRLEYATGFLAVPLVLMYLYATFPQETSLRIVRAVQVAGLLGLISVATPILFVSRLIPYYEWVVAAVGVYSLVVMFRVVRRRREAAPWYMAGLLLLLITTLHDLLVYRRVLTTTVYWLPVGVVGLIFTQSIILAQRATTAYRELEASRRQLTEREESVRRDIAELLHGRVQSRLVVTGHRLQEARELLARDPQRAAELLATAQKELEEVRETDVRRASHLLHPSIIRVGLIPALYDLLERFRGPMDVEVDIDPQVAELDRADGPGIPEAVRLAAYRVLEEALNNVHNHAGAAKVRISVYLRPDHILELTVEDDGRGLAAEGPKLGLGLAVIAARVLDLKGDWSISPAPGSGTRLTAWFPLRFE